MGIYLNPGYDGFEAIRKDIYVDKTGLIEYINDSIGKPRPLVSFSRPRRFGKSYTAKMLCAYYDRSCDSRFLFEDLKIASSDSFETHLNQYNVITFDVTGFMNDGNGKGAVDRIREVLLKELKEAFPDCVKWDEKDLKAALVSVVSGGNAKFVFVIDEWDAIFRECKDDEVTQKMYILFLRDLFKNKDITDRVVAAAYMTGILPIKKYGTESALSDFREISVTRPARLAEFVGFTEDDVKKLCSDTGMEFDDMRAWYDGYSLGRMNHVYNPNSVMNAIWDGEIQNYWMMSETFNSLKGYIGMNFDGLKDAIIAMLGGESVSVRVSTFQNDITSFKCKDDVLTLLIHLGYLAYDSENRKIRIPNLEVAEVFEDAVSGEEWGIVGRAILKSEELLEATLQNDEESVATALEQIHGSVSSVLNYNNEASLSCAITIAYYTAKRFYQIVRELPAGKGFADLAFLPRKNTNKPALLVELKYDKDADSAIRQIHENRYDGELKEYFGNVLLVGINYDKDSKGEEKKRHSCVIERV